MSQQTQPEPDQKQSTYTDPNVYLKLDPIKKIQSKLARSIDYEHIIITRFSYRFKKDMPIGELFSHKRLQRRFQLFETFCLPSVLSQVNPNFYWIIIIDAELPTEYVDRLWKSIAKFYGSNKYSKFGPRQIFVHRWDWTCTLTELTWIEKYIQFHKRYLITTRLDDDDSICREFTNIMAQYLRENKIRGLKLLSLSNGYYWYNQPKVAYGIFKQTNKPWIAIGLSLITERSKFPMTVYFGNHTKLTGYLRNWQDHRTLKKYVEKSKENITPKTYVNYFEVIRRTKPIYIRSVHDHNLQRNETNKFLDKSGIALKRASLHSPNMLNKYFTINIAGLEKVNSAI